VRTAAEIASVLAENPFPELPANRIGVVFLDHPPPADSLTSVTGQSNEEICLGRREFYVYYPDGMGVSKLKIRAAKDGTVRNMNTVAKLAEMAVS
jgi:uncharacterized protein (DUF1697 family)